MTKPKKQFAILIRKLLIQKGGALEWETETLEVEVMATKSGYAMVRRKRCAPFIAQVKDLTPIKDSA